MQRQSCMAQATEIDDHIGWTVKAYPELSNFINPNDPNTRLQPGLQNSYRPYHWERGLGTLGSGAHAQATTPTWTQVTGTNCYPESNGATTHSCCQRDVYVVQTVDECKQRCTAAAGCEAIVYQSSNSRCYLRHGVQIANCASQSSFDTYTHWRRQHIPELSWL